MSTGGHEAEDQPSPIRRQAIVVVHGQGRQRPMGTVRDFVKVLWSFNEELGQLQPVERKSGRETWIVPDDKTGLFDLYRITTPELDGRRTDFFELYYADLLVDTPIRNLWLWMQRLLWIDRRNVTQPMRWPWFLFWVVNVVALGLFVAFLLRLPTVFDESWTEPLQGPDAIAPLAAIAVAVLVVLLPRFSVLFGWLERIPVAVPFGVVATAIVVIYWPKATSAFEVPTVLILLLLGGLIYIVSAAILPTFGGAASYLSAQAETVRSREAVRRRGLEMLRALHDDPVYDRIVVVAHSLGSVLAYDLLQLMWRAVGPTKDNPPADRALAALRAVDEHTGKMGGRSSWSDDEIDKHQRLQWRAFEALSEVRTSPDTPEVIGGWKISDFVSLGSPLASAQFLMTDGVEDFDRLKSERLLPTAPPDPYQPGELAVHKAEGRDHLHHAAVFSAVRWTNIYDRFHPVFVLFGDVISGPVAPQFGPAIRDVDARIGSFFSHGRYWIDPSGKGAPHIVSLRDAVGMDRGGLRRDASSQSDT